MKPKTMHRAFAGLLLAILTGCTIPLPKTPPSTATPISSPTAPFTPAVTLTPTVTPTWTPEPLVPTPLPTSAQTALPSAPVSSKADAARQTPTTAATAPAATPTRASVETVSTEIPAASAPRSWDLVPASDRQRLGVGIAIGQITDYDWGDGLPGWYLNWRPEARPKRPGDIAYAQMVFTVKDGALTPVKQVRAIAARNPGSLWLIGNEPDVAWQGNSTPEQYASAYHTFYAAIKESDPTAKVAIGGVSQPTPMRIEYIERILAAYEARFGEPMPVDVWNIHNFILREERDSWGVGIPPGMDANQGTLYEIADHTDTEIFRQQIVDFRRWMAENGFREKPLLVSEYGVLMPESYGFPPDAVSQFMLDTFDYFLTARDPELGYPADDNRLVQAFTWYSAADSRYATPNLFDPETNAVTPLGEIFRAYAAGLP